jgi:predicted alpha/beta-hydrolase family hydrolase
VVSRIEVDTAYGPGRLVIEAAAVPRGTLLLSHGAGNGIDTHDLAALAATLPAAGITVARFEQPWRVAGRKVATPPATLDVGLTAAAGLLDTGGLLVVGGRSAGARSAARTARALGAAGLLALAFPLHPPGRPEKSRLDELTGAGVATLILQGERDPMGRPEEFPDQEWELVVVPGADHGLKVAKSSTLGAEGVARLLTESVLDWWIRSFGNR